MHQANWANLLYMLFGTVFVSLVWTVFFFHLTRRYFSGNPDQARVKGTASAVAFTVGLTLLLWSAGVLIEMYTG